MDNDEVATVSNEECRLTATRRPRQVLSHFSRDYLYCTIARLAKSLKHDEHEDTIITLDQ